MAESVERVVEEIILDEPDSWSDFSCESFESESEEEGEHSTTSLEVQSVSTRRTVYSPSDAAGKPSRAQAVYFDMYRTSVGCGAWIIHALVHVYNIL